MASAEGSRFKPFKFSSSSSSYSSVPSFSFNALSISGSGNSKESKLKAWGKGKDRDKDKDKDKDKDDDKDDNHDESRLPPPPPPKDPIYRLRANSNNNANNNNANNNNNNNNNLTNRSRTSLSVPDSPSPTPSPSSPSIDGAQYAYTYTHGYIPGGATSASGPATGGITGNGQGTGHSASAMPGYYYNNTGSSPDLVSLQSSSAMNTTTGGPTKKEKALGFLKFPKRSPRSPPPAPSNTNNSGGVLVIGGPGSTTDDADPPPPQEDDGISLPWNFQHNIHVDEGYVGLPPSWSTSLAEAGFTEDEIAAIHSRRAAGVRSPPDMRYLYNERPQSPAVVGFPRGGAATGSSPLQGSPQHNQTVPILTHPTPRTTSLPRLVPPPQSTSSTSLSSPLASSSSPVPVFSPPPPHASAVVTAKATPTGRVPPPKRKPPSPYVADGPGSGLGGVTSATMTATKQDTNNQNQGRGHRPNQASGSTVGDSSDSHSSSNHHEHADDLNIRHKDPDDQEGDITTKTNFTNMSVSEAYNYNPPSFFVSDENAPPLPVGPSSSVKTGERSKGGVRHPYANPANIVNGSEDDDSGSEYGDEEDSGAVFGDVSRNGLGGEEDEVSEGSEYGHGGEGVRRKGVSGSGGKAVAAVSPVSQAGGGSGFRVVNGTASNGAGSSSSGLTTALSSTKKSIWGTKIVPQGQGSSSSSHLPSSSFSETSRSKGLRGLGGLDGAGASASSPALVNGSMPDPQVKPLEEYTSSWKTTPTTTVSFSHAASAGIASAVSKGGSLVDAVRSKIAGGKGKERDRGNEKEGGKSRSRSRSVSRSNSKKGKEVDSDEEFASLPVDSPPAIGGETRTPVWQIYTRPRAGTDASLGAGGGGLESSASISTPANAGQGQLTRKSSLKSSTSHGSLRSRLGRFVNPNGVTAGLSSSRNGSTTSVNAASSGHGHSQSYSQQHRSGSSTSLDSIPEKDNKPVPPLPDDAKQVARSASVKRDNPLTKNTTTLPPRLSLHQGTGSTDLSSWSESLLSGISLSGDGPGLGLGLSFGLGAESEKDQKPERDLKQLRERDSPMTVTTATVTARPWDHTRKLPSSKPPPSRPIPPILPLKRAPSKSSLSSSSSSSLVDNAAPPLPPSKPSPPVPATLLSPPPPSAATSGGPDSGQLWGEIERMMDPGMMSSVPGLHLSVALPPGAQGVLRSAGLHPLGRPLPIAAAGTTVGDLVGSSPVEDLPEEGHDYNDAIQDPSYLSLSTNNNRNSSRSSSSTLTLTSSAATIVRNASVVRRVPANSVSLSARTAVGRAIPASPLSSHFGSASGSEESAATRSSYTTSTSVNSHHPHLDLTVSHHGREDQPHTALSTIQSAAETDGGIGSPLLYYLDGTQTPSPLGEDKYHEEYRNDEYGEEEVFEGYPDEETMEAQRLAAAAVDDDDDDDDVGPTIVVSQQRNADTTNGSLATTTIPLTLPLPPSQSLSYPLSPSPLTSALAPSPRPIYPGWLSALVEPLSEFIDYTTPDPRVLYTDLTEIAEGESGSVFRAKMSDDDGLGTKSKIGDGYKWVAIKSIAIVPDGSPKLIDLKRELTLMRRIFSSSPSSDLQTIADDANADKPRSHPNILTLDALHIDLVEDSLWIRMQLMTRSLADIIALVPAGLQLQERTMARFAGDVLNALSFLEEMGVVHGDVRSDNVLVDETGVLKLADFSNAVQLPPTNPMRTEPVGVVFWQAPEVRRPPYDARRIDIWSLGATVWEMASQDPPFADTQQLAERWPPLKQPELYSPAFHEFLRLCSEPAGKRVGAKELLKSSFIVHKACGRHVVVLLLSQCTAIEKLIQEGG